jgi:hypothetical protein
MKPKQKNALWAYANGKIKIFVSLKSQLNSHNLQ